MLVSYWSKDVFAILRRKIGKLAGTVSKSR